MGRSLDFRDKRCTQPAHTVLAEMYRILSEAAADAGKTALLETYSEIAIHNYLKTCQPKTTDAALDRLQKAEDARAELHQLELVMDKRLFAKLVTNGGVARCGVGKNGEMVTWMDCIEGGIWNYELGSAQAAAWIRAVVWRFEAPCSQFFCKMKSPDEQVMWIMDQRGRSLLDSLNLSLSSEAMRIMIDLFLLDSHCLCFLGAPRILSFLYTTVSSVFESCGWHASKNISFLNSSDEARDLLQDPSQVPEWIVKDGSGISIHPYDRTSVWCLERCLCDEIGQKVTNKDLYAQSWPWSAGERAPVVAVASASILNDAEAYPSTQRTTLAENARSNILEVKVPYGPRWETTLESIQQTSNDSEF